ncbi:hypothetical protein [Nonomuraea maheshkhaliensis]
MATVDRVVLSTPSLATALMSACMSRKEDPLGPILSVVIDGLRGGASG